MQEELFHLFNTLYDSNRQIVFSSDQHPNYIPNLEERLKSRFNAGMIVDIGAPDKESRIAILRAKSRVVGFSFSDEVFEYLATTIDGNVRELEGALNTLICQSQLKQKDLSLNEVKTLLKNNLRPRRIIPIKDVVRVVADFYNIEEESIYKKTRKKEVVKPRQLIMYILREDFSLPYPTIGQKIGDRDHTTVIHSYEKIKRELGGDPELEQEINQIRALL
jgi:chromosomal replication initiator protein